MRQEAFELHALLQAARVPAPYVLVGHSIGGLLVRLYAAQYGDEVAGLVLVEPTHESGILGSVRYGGLVRLREKASARVIPEPRLLGAPTTEYRPEDDYMAEEFQQIYLATRANPRPLGGRPLIVLAAGKRPPAPPGTSAELWNTSRDERDQQLRDLASLSSNAIYVQDPESGHQLPADNPGLVVQAIAEVVRAAAAGARLAPLLRPHPATPVPRSH